MAELHEKAYQDYLGGMKYKDIAAKYGVSLDTVKSWKKRHWRDDPKRVHTNSKKGCTQNEKSVHPKQGRFTVGNKKAVGHGAPKGNKNSLGNKGGPGGPTGNKKAVVTGAYETIWMDCLSKEEQEMCARINTDKLAQVEEEIQLITIRERRMMERIQDIMGGLSEKQRKVLQERQMTKEAVFIKDPFTNETKSVIVSKPNMVVTSIEETERRKIDDVLRIEEALTRIQDKKARLLALKHTLEIAGKAGANAGAEEHAQRVQEAWANR